MSDECLFCKIIAGEIPSNKVYSDDDVYAFHDINAAAPVHILIIPKRHLTGVVHAGRKGTQQRILSQTLATLVRVFGSKPVDIIVGLGPAIGGCCYEVDAPCLLPFQSQYADWERFTRKSADGKYWLNLLSANKLDALSGGVESKNIFDLGECTACHQERWFSYRKEGPTGRMVSLTMLRAP